jgi:hypothetical protein
MPWSTASTVAPTTSAAASRCGGDSAPGSIVELRAFEDARGERRVALAVRSDLDLQHQVNASGATWLDRQSIAREPVAMSEGGFGAEVRHAMRQRAEHLVTKVSPSGKAAASSSAET